MVCIFNVDCHDTNVYHTIIAEARGNRAVKKFTTDQGKSVTAADRAAADKLAAQYGLGTVVSEAAAPVAAKPLRFAMTDGEGGFSPPIPAERLAAAIREADDAGAYMTPVVLLDNGNYRPLTREEKQAVGLPVPPAEKPAPAATDTFAPYGGDDYDDDAPRGFTGRNRYFNGG
jgi:hypothetical protein